MKRFYKHVTIADGAILLDGRQVRTPARVALVLPSPALAEAVAEEWRAQGETIDPRSMPLTGLANAAIDRVAPDPKTFVDTLAVYAETDLLCYRAEAPPELAVRQAEAWDPLLVWARRHYDVDFALAQDIVHIAQPEATVTRLVAALRTRDAFALAAMSPLVTIGGSLVTALAVAEGAATAEAGFDLTYLDELWQAERWGEDAQATEVREARRIDFLAAARFLTLVEAEGDGRD